MTYLYGDSTDSGLELNYIELLRDFLDFAVQVVLSEYRIQSARDGFDDKKKHVAAELESLQSLSQQIQEALKLSEEVAPSSPVRACVSEIKRAADHSLSKTAKGMKSELAQDAQAVQLRSRREHSANLRLVESLLLNHHLPDSASVVDISLLPSAQGHQAQMNGSCKQGLSWQFVAEIPDENPFAQIRKVAALAPELTIDLPEMSGFVRKSVKLKPYKIFPLYITGFSHEGDKLLITLRQSLNLEDATTGLDLEIQLEPELVRICRWQKGDKSDSFEAEAHDRAALLALARELAEDSDALVDMRSKLLSAQFGGKDLAQCEEPMKLVLALMGRIAPVIQKISQHSLTESELVLKRVLAGDRREEIFASKADLLGKLHILPAKLQEVFAPLGLGKLGEEDDAPTRELSTEEAKRLDSYGGDSSAPRLDSALAALEEDSDEPTHVASAPAAQIHEISAIAADHLRAAASKAPQKVLEKKADSVSRKEAATSVPQKTASAKDRSATVIDPIPGDRRSDQEKAKAKAMAQAKQAKVIMPEAMKTIVNSAPGPGKTSPRAKGKGTPAPTLRGIGSLVDKERATAASGSISPMEREAARKPPPPPNPKTPRAESERAETIDSVDIALDGLELGD